MTLSAIELMDLSDKLDALMSKAATASGMELLDISDEIDQIMQQMGYGVSGSSSGEEKQPSVHDGVPKLVADFLADKFVDQSTDAFIGTLQDLSQYVGTYIDLDQVKQHTAAWIAANIKEAA
ncbi:ddrA [Escherichia coli]|nr:ddrA [Escherichia coli]EII3337748.1 ddrA [Escherichia coli]